MAGTLFGKVGDIAGRAFKYAKKKAPFMNNIPKLSNKTKIGIGAGVAGLGVGGYALTRKKEEEKPSFKQRLQNYNSNR